MTQQSTSVGEQKGFHLLVVNKYNPCLGFCYIFFALIVHFKVRTGPQKGSSGEENTQSTLHMAIGPYRILYVLPALLGVCVV